MHKIEGNNKLVIEFDPNSKVKSTSSKTFLLASSHGYQEGQLPDGTQIGISYNITRKAPN